MFTRVTFQEVELPFRDRINQCIDTRILLANAKDKEHFLNRQKSWTSNYHKWYFRLDKSVHRKISPSKYSKFHLKHLFRVTNSLGDNNETKIKIGYFVELPT